MSFLQRTNFEGLTNEHAVMGQASVLIGIGATLILTGTSIASEKILLSSHIGNATIIKVIGTDTKHAKVTFRRSIGDITETCARETADKENEQFSDQVATCVEGSIADMKPVYERRGNCQTRTLYTEFGNFSMINFVFEASSTDASYKPVRTDWKDHKTEEIIGNCGGCGTPQLIDTLRVLCPSLFKRLFSGSNPH